MGLASTLTHALERAGEHGDRGFNHLREGAPAQFVPFSELAQRAQRLAAGLQAANVKPGDRVALILVDSVEFIEAIFGCMIAGAIAVPMYPPMNLAQLQVWLSGCEGTIQRAGCKLILTDATVRPLLGTLMGSAASVRAIETLVGLLSRVPADASARPTRVTPDDVAFLQFTSGSTSRPKGVTLTHANLIANAAAIGEGLGLSLQDNRRGVSWLPLYHDMGLIGCVFTPVVHAMQSVTLIAPLLFLKRPSIWLREISERRAHFTFAPNFAYGLANTRVKDRELAGLDLSSLTVAGCGAEPIQHQTLQAFADRYQPYGFQRKAFLPCYGMAEHSLAVTFVGLDEDLRADRVDPGALAAGTAQEPEGESALEIVSCGRPFTGHELLIVDAAGKPLPERRVGQITLRGPSVMRGYWDDPEHTARVLHEGWLSTGDLGYLKDGELYVTGRIKDLIIINGRNFYPTDLEWLAGQVEGVRRGNVVAFSHRDAGAQREQVVIVAEAREPERAETIRSAVTTAILEALSLRVDEVLVLPPGSLPKTSSGKLQRARTAALHAQGRLGPSGTSKLGLALHLVASRWSYIKAGFRRPDSTAGD